MPKKAVKKQISKKAPKKELKKAISKSKFQKKTLIIIQALVSLSLGLILSLFLSWFYTGAEGFSKAPFSLIFAFSMVFGIPMPAINFGEFSLTLFIGMYPIGVFIGNYVFARIMKLKGNFIMSLAGLVSYIVIFELTKTLIMSELIFWIYTILLPIALIMLFFYAFILIERKAL